MSASPTQDTSSAPTKPTFTEKEEKVMKLAWSCLKPPPDIDIEKLREVAEFNTTKTASNTWGVIKKKLAAIAPMAEGEGSKAAKGTPKKRSKKADEDVDDESPSKKRKTPKKKAAAAAEEAEEAEAVKQEHDE